VAVFVIVAALGPLLMPHAGDDDQLCVPVEAGSGTPVMRTPAAAPQPHHCAVCHSIRSFRTALADCGPAAARLVSEQAVAAAMRAWRRAPALDRLPARAPPA
jgi:hypothetical protein